MIGMSMCGCHQPAPPDAYAALVLVLTKLDALEALMATAAEQIALLTTRVEALGTLLNDVAADFAAFKAAMEAERENLTPTGQAALDAANAALDNVTTGLTNLDVAVGDADHSDDTPPETP
jgi:hypothetical protein